MKKWDKTRIHIIKNPYHMTISASRRRIKVKIGMRKAEIYGVYSLIYSLITDIYIYISINRLT